MSQPDTTTSEPTEAKPPPSAEPAPSGRWFDTILVTLLAFVAAMVAGSGG